MRGALVGIVSQVELSISQESRQAELNMPQFILVRSKLKGSNQEKLKRLEL